MRRFYNRISIIIALLGCIALFVVFFNYININDLKKNPNVEPDFEDRIDIDYEFTELIIENEEKQEKWISGNYTHYNGKYEEYPSRISHAIYDEVIPGARYKVNITNDTIHMLVRELDENQKFLTSHDSTNGEIIELKSNTKYVAITLYIPNNKKITFEEYCSLFSDGMKADFLLDYSIQEKKDILFHEISNCLSSNDNEYIILDSVNKYQMSQNDIIDVYNQMSKSKQLVDFFLGKNMLKLAIDKDGYVNHLYFQWQNYDKEKIEFVLVENNLTFNDIWISGNYTHYNGKYEEFPSRISHVDYDKVIPSETYMVKISDERFRMLIRELDADFRLIKSNNCANCEIIKLSDMTQYVAVTIYDPDSKKINYEDYKNLFDNGMKAEFNLVADELQKNEQIKQLILDSLNDKNCSYEDIANYNFTTYDFIQAYPDIFTDEFFDSTSIDKYIVRYYDNKIISSFVSNTLQGDNSDKSESENYEEKILKFNNTWMSGDYTFYDGKYEINYHRICHKEYDRAISGAEYEAKISDERFHLLVRELSYDYSFIKSSNLSNGDHLTLDENTQYLAISVYSPSYDNYSFDDYKNMFLNGLDIMLQQAYSLDEASDEIKYFISEAEKNNQNTYIDISKYGLTTSSVENIVDEYTNIDIQVYSDIKGYAKKCVLDFSYCNEQYDVANSGILGDGVTDYSNNIMQLPYDNLFFGAGKYVISIECARFLNTKKISGDGEFIIRPWSTQWNWIAAQNSNRYTGTCKIQYLNDDIYSAAHWVAEADMTEDARTNLVATELFTLDENIRDINCQGFICRVKDREIPDEFTLCIGKCKLYAYKNGEWNLLSNRLPDFSLFDASWKDNNNVSVKDTTTYYDDHIEIKIRKEQWFANNDERLLHYFTKSYILSDDENASEYQYFLTCTDIWIKEKEYEDLFGFKIGSDLRDRQGTIYELGLGKLDLIKSYPRKAYFYTVPDNLYDELLKNKIF